MDYTGRADYLIKQSGCGPFQALLILFVDVMIKVGTVCTMMFMVFGNYNPGWRCLDANVTSFPSNNSQFVVSSFLGAMMTTSLPGGILSNSDNSSSAGRMQSDDSFVRDYNPNNTASRSIYSQSSCELFKVCQNVEFNPETSTIVSEWSLICDRAWIAPFIISIQMTGVLIGSLMAGHLGDMFGRKKTLYIALATLGVLSIVAKFSFYWQVFTVLRFFMGVMIACLYNLYNILPAEFLSSTWRVRLASIPSWQIGGLLFAVASMLFKSWEILHLIIGVYCLLACIPAIWVPESLRWLEVKNKPKNFQKVAQKMIAMNKAPVSLDSCDKSLMMLSVNEKTEHERNYNNTRMHSVLDLFRKGYRLHSIIIACLWVIGASGYYAISFGVKAMSGDFYLNLILLFVADIPYSLIPMYVPNILGRKKASMLFSLISASSLLTVTGLGLWASESALNTGSIVLGLAAKANMIGLNAVSLVFTAEIFPTVVRSSAMGYGSFWARVGCIVAPLLIPTDEHRLHIFYGALGVLCLVACLLVTQLPETKGKALKEVFDEG